MQLALIDDNLHDLKIIEDIINSELNKYSCSYNLDTFNDPNLLDSNKFYHVLFLDIDMPKNGIDLAREYLCLNPQTLIIFISSHSELVFNSLDVHPYYFIKKDELSLIMPKIITSLIDKFTKKTKVLNIKTTIGTIDIPLNIIKYIESNKHYCYIITTKQTYTTRDKLSNIYELLNNDFCRIHQTTIINFQYIHEYKNNTIKIDKQYFTISKTYQKNTKNSYLEYIKRSI